MFSSLFKAWFIIILVFLVAVLGVLRWLQDFAPYYSFAMNSKPAKAIAASKMQKPGEGFMYLGEIRFQFPLKFITESGDEVVSSSYYRNTYVPRWAIDALERDGHITVLYLPDDPQRVLFEGDIQKMPKGYVHLVWELAFLAISVALVPRRYQLARYTKYEYRR